MMSFVIDLDKNYNSYFKAYMKMHNLKNGDEWEGYKFINWLSKKHTEFQKMTGIGIGMPYAKEQEVEFVKFINMVPEVSTIAKDT